MDLASEERQRSEFRNILFELSESQEILKEKSDRSRIYRRLEALYHPSVGEQSFRHFYSDIFSGRVSLRTVQRYRASTRTVDSRSAAGCAQARPITPKTACRRKSAGI